MRMVYLIKETMTMIKLKDRKQKCEECLNKLKAHDTVVGALAIVVMIGIFVMMILDKVR